MYKVNLLKHNKILTDFVPYINLKIIFYVIEPQTKHRVQILFMDEA